MKILCRSSETTPSLMSRCPFLVAACLLPVCSTVLATGGWSTAPQGLDHYVGRLPGKSLPQLLSEAPGRTPAVPGLDAESAAAMLREITGDGLTARSRADALASCERFLEATRRSANLPVAWANLGLDLRDCLADAPTPDAEAMEYCRWRIELGPIGPETTDDLSAKIEGKLGQTTGRSAAHLRFLLGALAFQAYEGDKGEAEFSKLIEDYPGHPRAETAAFMVGRARLSAARDSSDSAAIDLLVTGAGEAFNAYLNTYPKGRYSGDVLGWLGAVEIKRDDLAAALDCYLRQLEVVGHPENQRSASRMVERVLFPAPRQTGRQPDPPNRQAPGRGDGHCLLAAPRSRSGHAQRIL